MTQRLFDSEAAVAAWLREKGLTSPQIDAHAPSQPRSAEATLLAQVRQAAKLCGFLIYHTYRSNRSEPGFPDLVLCKPGRLIFAELKSATGKVTQEQATWLALLARSVPAVEVYTWRPQDFDSIVTILTTRPPSDQGAVS